MTTKLSEVKLKQYIPLTVRGISFALAGFSNFDVNDAMVMDLEANFVESGDAGF